MKKKFFKIVILLFFICSFSMINAESNNMTESEYNSLNVKRSYIIGDYIFDLSRYNPSLQDLMLAAQTQDLGDVSVYELVIAEDIDGNVTKKYTELLDNNRLSAFPSIKPMYICTGSIGNENCNIISK